MEAKSWQGQQENSASAIGHFGGHSPAFEKKNVKNANNN